MRPALVRLQLRWPREVTEQQMASAWRRLPALAGWPLIVESIGRHGLVHHRLRVPVSRQMAVIQQLRAEIPGIGIEEDTSEPIGALQAAGQVRLSTRRRAVATADLGSASRALLTALAMARGDEVLMCQWILGKPLHPQATPSGSAPLSSESWFDDTIKVILQTPQQSDAEPRRTLAAKQSEPGWQALGRLAVRASTPKRRELLLRHLAGAIRSLETPGLSVMVRSQRPARAERAAIPWRYPLRLNAVEMAALSSWPVGTTSELPVEAQSSRPLPAPRSVPRRGRIVAESDFPGSVRPLALSTSASLRHLYALGPTGTGKSTLLLNLISQDLESGHGVVVIEPKGDLINDVLARIPAERLNDVVLLDPTDRQSPVGLNPLEPMGRSAELVADQLLGTLHALYAAHWGPRTQDILGAALLTVAQVPGMSLIAVPLILTNGNFRRKVLSRINDPVGLGPFWAGFEAWSEAERTVATAPILNKIRPFLMRPALRAVLGQAEPRFDLRQVFTKRRVLLVNLAQGQLGPEAAELLGSLVFSQLWQAAQGRSKVAPELRRPTYLHIDEWQKYLRLPVDLADMLAQARGLGLSLTMANQHLAQLSPDIRAAVLANASSKVAFRLAPDDARVMAANSRLDSEDFGGLGAYECYVQLVADNAVQPWASGRSLPPPPKVSDPEVVRAASRANFGRDRSEVDADIERLISGGRTSAESADDLAPRLRGGAQ